MKPNLLMIICVLFIATLHAQILKVADQVSTTQGPKITFDNTVHDFGILPYMGEATHVYNITNTGNEPLIITNCIKGFGFTLVNWTKFAILPGRKGIIKVTYDTKAKGPFYRGVDVYSNDSHNSKINLRIRGTVDNDTSTQNIQMNNAAQKPVFRW